MKTHRSSRREFLGLTGAGLAGGLAGVPSFGATAAAAAGSADASDADLVVLNAKVYTMDAACRERRRSR